MSQGHHDRTSPEAQAAWQRLLDAAHLQEIEGNPFDAEDMAMFAMFEREGWSVERRLAYVAARAKGDEPRSLAAE